MCFTPQGCTFSTSQLPKVVRQWKACFVHHKGALFRHLNFQKWSETVSFLKLLTWKCASRHKGALFRHLNFQKWSDNGKRVLYILTWKCASGHNGAQLFISHLTTWLRTHRFSEPTCRPSGASVSRLSYLFAQLLFFLRTLTLLWSSLFGSSPPWLFPPLLFHLSILSEIWLLNFLRWYTNILTQYPMCVCIWILWIYIVLGLQALTYLRHIWVQKPPVWVHVYRPPVQVVQVEIWPFAQERNGATCQEVFLPRPGRHIGWF